MLKSIITSTALVAGLVASPCAAQDTMPGSQQPPSSQMPPSPIPDQTQPPTSTAPRDSGTPASVKASDPVYDSAGNTVGTIQSVEGSIAVLSTGTATVRLPVSAITQGPKGLTIGATKAEVEAQAKKKAPQP